MLKKKKIKFFIKKADGNNKKLKNQKHFGDLAFNTTLYNNLRSKSLAYYKPMFN
jgi:hypothetical protein